MQNGILILGFKKNPDQVPVNQKVIILATRLFFLICLLGSISSKAQSFDTLVIPSPLCGSEFYFSSTGITFSSPYSDPDLTLEVVDSASNFSGATQWTVLLYPVARVYPPSSPSPGRKKARLKYASPFVLSDSVYFTIPEGFIQITAHTPHLCEVFGSNIYRDDYQYPVLSYQTCGALPAIPGEVQGLLSDAEGNFSPGTLCSLSVFYCDDYSPNCSARLIIPNGLPSGNYKVKAYYNDTILSDSSNCITIYKGEITPTLSHVCQGDSILLTSAQASLGHYRWFRLTESSLDSFPDNDDGSFYAKQVGFYFAKIFEPTYYGLLTVTDTVEVIDGPCPKFTVMPVGPGATETGLNTYTLCNDAQNQVLLTGDVGFAPVDNFFYQYSWNSGPWQDSIAPDSGKLTITNWQSGTLQIQPFLPPGFNPTVGTITIDILPPISAHFAFENSACAAILTELDTNVQGTDNITYTWTAPGANNEAPTWDWTNWTGGYLSYTNPGAHEVSLTVTNLMFGCSKSDTLGLNTDSLHLQADTIWSCIGGSATGSVVCVNGTGPHNYVWNMGDCTDHTANCDSIFLTNPSNPILVSGTDSYGCTGSFLVPLMFYPVQLANLTFDTAFCSVLITDSLSGKQISVSAPGAIIESGGAEDIPFYSQRFAYGSSGEKSISVTITDMTTGCSEDTTFVFYPRLNIKVQVPPVYVNQALTSYGIAIGSLGVPWQQPGQEPYEYAWYKSGVPYSSGNQMSAPDTSGPYFVVATDSLGCQASDTLTYVYRDMYSTRSIWVKNHSYDSVRIGWDSLTSVQHFVVVREGSPVTWVPQQGKGYATHTELGLAPLGTNHYAIYSGTSGHTALKGLVPNKTYYTAVFAWKMAGGDTLWDTTHVQQRFQAKYIAIPKVLEISQITGHSVRLKWKSKPGLGILLAGRRDSAINSTPVDSVAYADTLSYAHATDTLSDGSRILFAGTSADSVVVGGLDSNAVYHFKIWYYREQNGQFYYGSKGKELPVQINTLAPDSLRLEPDSGIVSDKVLISGINLLGVDGIRFGNTQTDFKPLASGVVKVVVPVGNGVVSVQIRKNNIWYSAINNFSYRSIRNFENLSPDQIECKETLAHENPSYSAAPIIPPKTFYGGGFTPSGRITVPIVYIRDGLDNTQLVPHPASSAWPNPYLPPIDPEYISDFSYESFDEFEPGNTDFTMSNFYFQMSANHIMEPLQIIYKVFPIVIVYNPDPDNDGINADMDGDQEIDDPDNDEEVSNYMAAQCTSFFNNPGNEEWEEILKSFDRRPAHQNYIYDNNQHDPDGIFDFELHINRGNSWVGGFAGTSVPGFTFSAFGQDYTMAQSGVTILGMSQFPLALLKGTISHEFSHVLYSSPHVFFNNGVIGNHYTTTSGWGTMNANGWWLYGFNFLSNPFETWVQGWNRPLEIQTQAQAGIGPYYLNDFTHNFQLPSTQDLVDAIRIRIPGPASTYQSLWLTNHPGISNFDHGQNLLDTYGSPVTPDKGIFLMIDNMGLIDQNRTAYGLPTGSLKVLHPFGGLDIIANNYSPKPDLYSETDWHFCPDTKILRKNPFAGINKASLLRLKSPFAQPNDRFQYSSAGNSANNEVIFQRYEDGILKPGYRMEQAAFGNGLSNEKLGINYDVPIFNHQTFNDFRQDFSPIVLNGIYVEVYARTDQENLSEPRMIDIRYNENKFLNNRLLTGYFNVVNLPDLNPDIAVGSGTTINLDKALTPNRTRKHLLPTGNDLLYPDFITPSRFVCTPGSVLELEEGASFIIENESGLVIRAGATVNLGENARILVKSGCTLIIEQGAILTGETGATIEVEDNAYYCVATHSGLAASQVMLGYRLGSVSPKLAPYITPPTDCGNPLQNFKLAFQCSSGVKSIEILEFNETVDVVRGNTSVFTDVSTIPLSGLLDGHYTVKPRTSLVGTFGTYSTSFDLYGQSGAITWTSGDRSFSNILILNNNLSCSAGSITLEPNTQVYIKGTPVTPSCSEPGLCLGYVTGGDIALSGSTRLNVRDGATFQGMCGNMWGGVSISGGAMLSAYNNMIYRDSYDGIASLAGEDSPDLMQMHLFNARFENNYRAVKQIDAIDAFNFVRNCTFTSNEEEMKKPFDKPSETSCRLFFSNTHVEYDHCRVPYGNFWNNRLLNAQTALNVGYASRGFHSVRNQFEDNAKAVYLHSGSSVPLHFYGDNITLPARQLFCNASTEGASNYVTAPMPYSKFGFYVDGLGNTPVISDVTISGPGFAGATTGLFRNVGIYAHGGTGLTLTRSTLQGLNYGVVLYGSTVSGNKLNYITENLFADNEQNLRFKGSYKANFNLNLKCNRFTSPSDPAPFTNRYGIWVEAGALMPDIGGTGLDNNAPPAANWWPVAGTTNSSLSPWPVTALSGGGGVEHWYSPSGWETVHNLAEYEWKYFRYKNEYLGPISNPSGGITYFDESVVNRMVRSRSDQVIPSGELFDDACSNFGQVLVFPTRPAVSQDSTLTQKSSSFSGSADFLDQNIPNPASNSTTIGYRLPSDAKAAKLELFELSTGRIVKSVGIPVSGKGQVELGLNGIPGGLYGYRLIAGERPLGWKKMIVVR